MMQDKLFEDPGLVQFYDAENGWAEVEAGSPLGAVADKAKQAQKGIYGGDPRRK